MSATALPPLNFHAGFRAVFGSTRPLRQVISEQARLLRQAAVTLKLEDLRAQHRTALANHRQAMAVLQSALVTPFDSEDIALLLGGVARTVNCLSQLSESGPLPDIQRVSQEWIVLLAEIIPRLPEAKPVDEALPVFFRLDREFKIAERRAFRPPADDPLEAVRSQAIRERYQALGASLRALTFQTRHVRYRNG